ncbi:hypothetical protein AGMMS4956_12770 [Bacteroidia bacterium]|nr:hypothetical protein AGMMS4956_12770 [Bacteroidia bacterium]
MMKRVFALIIGVFFVLTAQSQNKSDSVRDTKGEQHEFALHGAGGLSMLNYFPIEGKQHLGLGGGGGLSSTYFFNQRWGLSLGVELMTYHTRYTVDNFSSGYPAFDDEENFDFQYTLNNYTENQRAVLLNIPLMMRAQIPIDEKKDFYVAFGGKLSLPITASYSSTAQELISWGYYPPAALELRDPEFRAFGTFTDVQSSGKLNFSTAAFVPSVEVGIKWYLNTKCALYTGIYADYGLTNLSKSSSPMVEYAKVINYADNSNMNPINSVLVATHNNADMAHKVVPFAAGIKLSLAFGNYKYKQPTPTPTSVKRAPLLPKKDTVGKDTAAVGDKSLNPRSFQPQQDARQYNILGTVDGYSLTSSKLDRKKQAKLEQVVTYLKAHPDVRIVCVGFTCNTQSEDKSYKQGLKRAQLVRDYLIKQGISRNRVRIRSYGQLQPLVPNKTKKNKLRNRRVEVQMVTTKGKKSDDTTTTSKPKATTQTKKSTTK